MAPAASAALAVTDDRQVLVFDRDQLGRVLRDGFGLGDDQRDRLADEAHPLDAQARCGTAPAASEPPTPLKNAIAGAPFHPVATRSAPVRMSSTPRQLLRCLDVDPHDLGMRAVGAEEMAGDLAVEMVIGGVAAPAGDQPKVFPAAPELMLRQVLFL